MKTQVCSLILIFLVVYSKAFSGVGEQLNRYKRQVGFGENKCAALCFFGFIGGIASNPEAAKKLEGKDSEDKSIFSFLNKDLLSICPIWKTLTTCISMCPNGTEVFEDGPKPAFAALQFICVDYFDDVKENLPCFEKANASVSESCEMKCEGAETIKAAEDLEKFEGNPEDVSEVLELLNKMCGYMQCLADCSTPIFEEECGSEEPGIFVRKFIRFFLGGALSPLTKLGLPAIIPEKCKIITSDDFVGVENDTLTVQDEPDLQFSSDFKDFKEFEIRKLEKELLLLEKMSKKLDLELEVLELEKKYFSANTTESTEQLISAVDSDDDDDLMLRKLRIELVQREYDLIEKKDNLIDLEIEKLKTSKEISKIENGKFLKPLLLYNA